MVIRSIQIARIIQYDSLSNNIGLKGLEYFTITYKFVASVSSRKILIRIRNGVLP